MSHHIIIGRTTEIQLPELVNAHVPARIDTGAKTSAIWISSAQVRDEKLEVVFFGKGSDYYTGRPVSFPDYAQTVVASSNGHTEVRYKVRLLVMIEGKRLRAWFTLADRSTQVYPVLIGRNILRGKFIVDVARGAGALREAEKKRTEELRQKLEEMK